MAGQRLIDANALKTKLDALSKIKDAHFLEGLQTAWAVVDVAPTIDAVPVVHGRWIANNICSVCKVGIRGWAIQSGYKFCPFCGAKMDGGAEC